MEDVCIPRSSNELWTQIVLPYVEEKLKTVPARAPEGVLPPDFYVGFTKKAQENFDTEINRKADFQKWAARIRNWEMWSHSLIPFEEINPQYVQGRLNEICYKKTLKSPPSGLLPETVRKFLHKRPNDVSADEFFRIVLSETTARFMKQYFSSFQEPIGSWVYNLARSAAEDYVKKWVPGYREGDDKKPAETAEESKSSRTAEKDSMPTEDVEKKTKGVRVESIDAPRKNGSEGGEKRWTLADTLPAQPEAHPRNAKFVEDLLEEHGRKSHYHRFSGCVVDLCKRYDHDPAELAQLLNLPCKNIRRILVDDLEDILYIAEDKSGIRRRHP